MFFYDNRLLFMLKKCSMTFLLVLFVSCTAAVKRDDSSFNSRLLAENSLMKKSIPLIEKENDIIKKENRQHRLKIQEQDLQLKQLGSELASLKEKYTNDMADGAEQIRILQGTIEKKEKESSETIETLISLKDALERKHAQEVQVLHEQIEMQKRDFSRTREQIAQENAKREAELSNQMNNLKKTISSKELEIASLKQAISEISIKLEEVTVLAETLRKARNRSLVELESAKAANTDLVKKMEAIAHELDLRNHGPQTGN